MRRVDGRVVCVLARQIELPVLLLFHFVELFHGLVAPVLSQVIDDKLHVSGNREELGLANPGNRNGVPIDSDLFDVGRQR